MRPNDASTLADEGRELRRLAEQAGCRVLGSSHVLFDGRAYPVLELDCENNDTAVRFLNAAARFHDARDPDVRELALRLRRAHPEDLPPTLQAFVQETVRFVREPSEAFQHTIITLRMRAGDCDDHARCVVALAWAAGLQARVAPVRNSKGQIVHVAPQILEGSTWRWAETTVAAHYGEHPRAAASRLGLGHRRPDIAEAP